MWVPPIYTRLGGREIAQFLGRHTAALPVQVGRLRISPHRSCPKTSWHLIQSSVACWQWSRSALWARCLLLRIRWWTRGAKSVACSTVTAYHCTVTSTTVLLAVLAALRVCLSCFVFVIVADLSRAFSATCLILRLAVIIFDSVCSYIKWLKTKPNVNGWVGILRWRSDECFLMPSITMSVHLFEHIIQCFSLFPSWTQLHFCSLIRVLVRRSNSICQSSWIFVIFFKSYVFRGSIKYINCS